VKNQGFPETACTDGRKKINRSQGKWIRHLSMFFPIYLHEYIKHETPPFHEEMFRILEDEQIKLAVFVAFRGSAKSTIISTAYVLWSILGIQQRKLIVICGQTEQKARQYLLNIKSQLLNNELTEKRPRTI
jgi:hypothetical protein